MTKILLSGCNGKMGRVIAQTILKMKDCAVVAGIDPNTEINDGFHVFPTPFDCGDTEADVIIDFSHPAALKPLLQYAEGRKLPIVVATTGLSQLQIQCIYEAAKKIPVFFSANMSMGVNLMVELCKTATRVLGSEFDIEIIEKHHNQKIDAPSGTAIVLADAIRGELGKSTNYVYERQSVREKRNPDEIGILSMRGGTIAGEHEVYFAGRDEILTISHSARSKEIFANGALNAAMFLLGKAIGLYSMSELIQRD